GVAIGRVGVRAVVGGALVHTVGEGGAAHRERGREHQSISHVHDGFPFLALKVTFQGPWIPSGPSTGARRNTRARCWPRWDRPSKANGPCRSPEPFRSAPCRRRG